jgi:hypothetical protein
MKTLDALPVAPRLGGKIADGRAEITGLEDMPAIT